MTGRGERIAVNQAEPYALPNMAQLLYLAVALLIGLGSAVQVGMLANIGRLRGPMEATWISLLATLGGVGLIFAIRSLRADRPELPSPFDNLFVFGAIGIGAGIALGVSLRGLSPYLAITGLFGFSYLMAAGILVPRIGIALFVSAVTAGTLLGSVALDHVGAFGADVHRLSFLKLLGVMVLFAGVALVRSGR